MTDYLHLPNAAGNNASTPDSPGLSVTGDLDLRVDLALTAYATGDNVVLSKSSFGASVEDAYMLRIDGSTPKLFWSSDGDNEFQKDATVPIAGLSASDRIHVRATLDVDNGASDAEIKFYWRDVETAAANDLASNASWTQLGTTVLFGSTTSINDGTRNLVVGSVSAGGGFGPFDGNLYRVMVLDGIAGSVEFDADFTDLTAAEVIAAAFTEDSSNAATVTLNGDEWALARIYTIHDILRETEALYMAGDGNKFGSPKWADRSGNNYHAQNGSAAGADANDALGKANDGDQYLFLPGTAGNTATSPSAVPLQLAGDMELIARLATDWTPTGDRGIIAKSDGGGNVGYMMRFRGSPLTLTIDISGVGPTDIAADTDVSLTDGEPGWLRITLDVDDGSGNYDVTFYESADDTNDPDAVSWSQIGAVIETAGTITLDTGTQVLYVGAQGGGFQPIAADMYRAVIKDGIDGTVVFDADFTDATTPYATFTERSINAATVTINRSATGLVATVIDQDQWLHTTDDYHEVPDAPGLDFAADESFTVMAVARTHDATPAAAITLVAKKAGFASSAVGYSIQNTDTGAGLFRIADGTVGIFDTFADITDGELFTYAGVRDVTTDDLEAFLDAVPAATPTSDTTTATLSNTDVLRIGRFSGAGTGYYEGSIMAVAIWRRALTDAEILDAHRLLTGQGLIEDNYLYLPGVSGEYPSTPDTPANSIPGDIDIRGRVALADWTPGALNVVASKWSTGQEYISYINSTGNLQLDVSLSGGNEFPSSSVALGMVDGDILWVRYTRETGSGDVRFWTADGAIVNPVADDFVQLGSTISTTAGDLTSSTEPLEVGSFGATDGPLTGAVYRVQIRDGIDGSVEFDADFTNLTIEELEAGTFVESSANAAVVTLNGDEWAYVRPYPHDDLLAPAELLLQASDGNKFFSPKWADRSRRNHHAQNGSAAGADANDALGKRNDGDQYVFLPDTIGNYLSTPDAAALDITGDIDLIARIALDDYTADVQAIVGKYTTTGNQRSYMLYVRATGTVAILRSSDGVANSVIASTVTLGSVGISDGQLIWIRATVDVDNGASDADFTFYYSTDATDDPDAVTWTQLGSVVNFGSTTSFFSGSSIVTMGRRGDANDAAGGAFYRAIIKDGIDGTIVFDAALEDAAQPYATFTERANNAVVTINRSTTGLVSTVIDRDQWLYSTDDNHEVDDHPALDFGLTDPFTLMVVARGLAPVTTAQSLLDKNNAGGEAGYNINLRSSDGAIRGVIRDASANTSFDEVAAPDSFTLYSAAFVRDVAADDVEAFKDGVGSDSPLTDVSVSSNESTDPLRIGRASGGVGSTFYEGAIFAVAIWRRALTDVEVLEAHALLIREVQYLRPDADVSIGGWTPTPSSPTTLFDKLDEVIASDLDYITEL